MLSHTRDDQDKKYEKVMKYLTDTVDRLSDFQKITEVTFPETQRVALTAADLARDARSSLRHILLEKFRQYRLRRIFKIFKLNTDLGQKRNKTLNKLYTVFGRY